jgi:hypothetical protein
MLKKYNRRVSTGFIWLRIRINVAVTSPTSIAEVK